MKKDTTVKLVSIGIEPDIKHKIRLMAAQQGIKIKDLVRKTFSEENIIKAGK